MSAPANQPAFLPAFAALLRRELVVEWRTRALVSGMGLFALLCVVVTGLGVRGLPTNETFHRFVLAVLWVCSLFAAIVGMNRAAQADQRRGLFAGLLLLPHDPALLFAVRLCTTLALLLLTQALMAIAAIPMLKLALLDQPLMLAVVPMADIGILAPGVLLSSATGRLRGGEALLTIALLPVAVPVFLGATGATDALQGGQGLAAAQPHLLLLGVCDAMFLALGVLLFGKLSEA